MRSMLPSLVTVLLLTSSAVADNTTGLAAPTGRPNYIAIDTLVINLNAVAGISYNATGNTGGTMTVTYLNGYTGSDTLKLSAEQWTKLQGEIVASENK